MQRANRQAADIIGKNEPIRNRALLQFARNTGTAPGGLVRNRCTPTECGALPNPQPVTRAHPPTFLMRTKRHFWPKGMSRRRLRRARELLAQIVLFGVEMDGARVSK